MWYLFTWGYCRIFGIKNQHYFQIFVLFNKYFPLCHMFCGTEAVGQQICHGAAFKGISAGDHVDHKIIVTEFPHHLAAHAAGRECAGNNPILTAADGDGGKVPMAVVNRLEDGGTLGEDGGGEGCVFNIAAAVYGAVGTQQRCAYLVAGIRGIGMGHGFFSKLSQFFRGHRVPPIVGWGLAPTAFVHRSSGFNIHFLGFSSIYRQHSR